MGQVLITEQYLSDIGSAIRAKAGTSEAFKPAQMASAIEAIPSGGEDLDNFIENGISGTYKNSRLTKIAQGAFAYTDIASINFPNVIYVGASAFKECKSLTQINLSAATTIGRYAFNACSSLSSVILSAVTTIEDRAFMSCTSLPSVRLSVTTTIGSYAFHNCSSLSSVRLSAVMTIGTYAFASCSSLSRVFVLGSSVCSLAAATAFRSTPMSNSEYFGVYGSIYVPSSLYSSYLTATNWTVYSSRFVSV